MLEKSGENSFTAAGFFSKRKKKHSHDVVMLEDLCVHRYESDSQARYFHPTNGSNLTNVRGPVGLEAMERARRGPTARHKITFFLLEV